ncbi:MORN repeat protein, putative [Anopheles sinensis]|uniref:MORN repeat protein, putative n=1 Tax=Anopheles sinensis TaxID=74873 RepID=A0A084WSJ4_ANOSI|nr:MORN repeat protein, putative [Anopheles sinensis]
MAPEREITDRFGSILSGPLSATGDRDEGVIGPLRFSRLSASLLPTCGATRPLMALSSQGLLSARSKPSMAEVKRC